jgi:hypothetical protein
MANEPGNGDEELPTQPLPQGEPVAPHVPIADVPTTPLAPVDAEYQPAPAGASGPPRRPRRGAPAWFWILIGVVVIGAVIAVIAGLTSRDGRTPAPVESPSITPSVTPTPSDDAVTPPADDAPEQPDPPAEPPAPTEPPDPQPTATPQPTESAAP